MAENHGGLAGTLRRQDAHAQLFEQPDPIHLASGTSAIRESLAVALAGLSTREVHAARADAGIVKRPRSCESAGHGQFTVELVPLITKASHAELDAVLRYRRVIFTLGQGLEDHRRRLCFGLTPSPYGRLNRSSASTASATSSIRCSVRVTCSKILRSNCSKRIPVRFFSSVIARSCDRFGRYHVCPWPAIAFSGGLSGLARLRGERSALLLEPLLDVNLAVQSATSHLDERRAIALRTPALNRSRRRTIAAGRRQTRREVASIEKDRCVVLSGSAHG